MTRFLVFLLGVAVITALNFFASIGIHEELGSTAQWCFTPIAMLIGVAYGVLALPWVTKERW